MNRRMYALLLVLMLPGAANAQPAALSPAAQEPLPRWDVAPFLGWSGARAGETGYNRRLWDGRFVYGGTVGYYWTANLKLEFDLSATAPSTYDTYEPRQFPDVSYPFYVRTDHRTVTAALGGTVIYQFFENAGFHPFVGAGAGWMTMRERITTERQTQGVSRGPNDFDVVVISEAQSRDENDSEALAKIVAGFKAYAGERVFFRSDVQWSAAEGRFRDISWRLGFGVDF